MPTMQEVKFKRKTTEEIQDLAIEDGSLIYNVENGKTYMDYGNERIPTGGGANGGIYVGDTEPTDEDITLWVDTNISETKASEIVNTYTESNTVGYSCNYINNCNTYSTSETFTGKYWIDGKKIYSRTFVNTNIAISTSGSTLGTISNIDTFVGSNYHVSSPNSKNSGRTGYLNSSYYSGIQVSSSGVISIYGKDGQANVYAQVTIEYTKTTD